MAQKEYGRGMKKNSIFAVFSGVFCALPFVADAAYPVYSGYPNANMMAGQQMVMPQQYVQTTKVPVQTYNMAMNPAVAAKPTRVTGALPRVGSSQTVAGRQYYQPADYDRLADSGLYVGLSAAYNASVMGGISADYTGEQDGFAAPGAFNKADFDSDTVIPLQLSVGAAINNDVRIDFSYLRYSGIAYPKSVETADGEGGFVATQNDGGAITANTTMLNIYYNIDSFTGYLAGGSLRPYVGAGVGISLNSIADYVVYDSTFYYIENDITNLPAGILTAISDVTAYHNGGTTEELAFMLEGGVTTELEGGIKLDFFVRYANLGEVKTSGSIVVSQIDWLSDGAGTEVQAPYDSVYHYTNWYESGRLGLVDVGLRLRLQF